MRRGKIRQREGWQCGADVQACGANVAAASRKQAYTRRGCAAQGRRQQQVGYMQADWRRMRVRYDTLGYVDRSLRALVATVSWGVTLARGVAQCGPATVLLGSFCKCCVARPQGAASLNSSRPMRMRRISATSKHGHASPTSPADGKVGSKMGSATGSRAGAGAS